MGTMILRRLLIAIPIMLAVIAIVFVALRTLVPGDPAAILAGENAPAELIERVRHEQGLDKPIIEQFGIFLGNLARGDLGRSSSTRQPVIERLRSAFPITLVLTLATFTFSMTFGLLVGIVTAYWHDTWIDNVFRIIAVVGAAMPTFWLGLMLILIFAVALGVLPVLGGLSVRGLILPTLTMGIGAACELSRLIRSSMLEVLSGDYIRTARAKGLGERLIMIRHALRNALIPIITIAAAQIGALLGGAVITEGIFGLPGIGTLAIGAITGRDYALIQGSVLFISVVYLCVNLMADIAYAFIDPRIRIQ